MMTMQSNQDTFFSKLLYLFRFVTRAFLISILCLLVGFGLLLTVYFTDLLVNTRNGNLKNPLFSAYIIVSPSMVPTIKVKDAIVIKRVDHDNYRIGDIISFASSDINYEGLTVTHRIVNKEEVSENDSVYTTKGDNNVSVDPVSVHTNAIYGRVLFKVPKLGYLQEFFAKPTNYFICLLIPTVVFIFYDVIRIVFLMSRKKI